MKNQRDNERVGPNLVVESVYKVIVEGMNRYRAVPCVTLQGCQESATEYVHQTARTLHRFGMSEEPLLSGMFSFDSMKHGVPNCVQRASASTSSNWPVFSKLRKSSFPHGFPQSIIWTSGPLGEIYGCRTREER